MQRMITAEKISCQFAKIYIVYVDKLNFNF